MASQLASTYQQAVSESCGSTAGNDAASSISDLLASGAGLGAGLGEWGAWAAAAAAAQGATSHFRVLPVFASQPRRSHPPSATQVLEASLYVYEDVDAASSDLADTLEDPIASAAACCVVVGVAWFMAGVQPVLALPAPPVPRVNTLQSPLLNRRQPSSASAATYSMCAGPELG